MQPDDGDHFATTVGVVLALLLAGFFFALEVVTGNY
jgi:hypothetical protein